MHTSYRQIIFLDKRQNIRWPVSKEETEADPGEEDKENRGLDPQSIDYTWFVLARVDELGEEGDIDDFESVGFIVVIKKKQRWDTGQL